MDKRGPRKAVARCVRVGEHGDTSWFIELECGHTLSRNRKAEINDKISCKSCMKNNVGVSSSSILLSNNTQEDLSRFDEIKTISKIASHFNVRMDQVELGRGMASIYLDAEEIRRITG